MLACSTMSSRDRKSPSSPNRPVRSLISVNTYPVLVYSFPSFALPSLKISKALLWPSKPPFFITVFVWTQGQSVQRKMKLCLRRFSLVCIHIHIYIHRFYGTFHHATSASRSCFWDRYCHGDAPISCWPLFSLVSSNNPTSLFESQLGPVSSRF